MSNAVIAIILLSAVLHAVWNAIIKDGPDKLCETSLKASGGALFMLCCMPFLPLPAPASLPFLAGTALLHLFYYLFMAYAYKGADMSYAYTLMRGSAPLFTGLFTVFVMGHSLSAGGWAGVTLLSAGILGMAFESLKRGNFNLAVTTYALANALVIMGYTVMDGTGVRLAGEPLAYICWVSFLNCFPITIFAVLRRGVKTYGGYLKKRWKHGLAGGVCSAVAYGLVVWCMNRAPISQVAALRETSVVFGMLLAVLFLKERMTPARAAAVLAVLAGSVIMRLFA
ncbi:MAG: DMT family transporter [Desulfovibrio sp.]|jgi:drug/metabolite transporter (DMT)-like permease|nr:DMT family transporter [Desulfovibrio sp.]